MIIALDTNFLVYCARQKLDFIREIERMCSCTNKIVVPGQVLKELEKLSKSNSLDSISAALALKMTKDYISKSRMHAEIIDADTADSALLELDFKGNAIATLDAELRAKFKNAKVIVIRQFNHLEWA
ncbi:MAG: PIN domain-containing protein [archaeon]